MTDRRAARARGSLGFVAVVVLLTAAYGLFFGVVIVGDAGFSADEAVHVGAAVGFTSTLVAGLVSQVVAPRRWPAGFWVTSAGILAVMIAAVFVGNPDNHGGQAGVFDWAFLIFLLPLFLVFALHPARGDLLHGARPSVPLIVAVAVLCIPLVGYGVDQALVQRNSWPPTSDPHHNAHWFTIAALAFAIPLVGWVAASRLAGRRIAAWCAAGMAVIVGATSAVWPDAASSLGVLWGIASVACGVALLLIATLGQPTPTPGDRARVRSG